MHSCFQWVSIIALLRWRIADDVMPLLQTLVCGKENRLKPNGTPKSRNKERSVSERGRQLKLCLFKAQLKAPRMQHICARAASESLMFCRAHECPGSPETVTATTVIGAEYAHTGHQSDVSTVFLPKARCSGDQHARTQSQKMAASACVRACSQDGTRDRMPHSRPVLKTLDVQKLEHGEPPRSGSS